MVTRFQILLHAAWALAVIGFQGERQPNPKETIEFPPVRGIRWVVIESVIDGDSFNYLYLVRSPYRGRIPHVDTPELKYPDGRVNSAGVKAREAMLKRIPPGSLQRVEFSGKERYGVLADPLDERGEPASKWLLDEKLALPWSGRGPKPKQEDLQPEE